MSLSMLRASALRLALPQLAKPCGGIFYCATASSLGFAAPLKAPFARSFSSSLITQSVGRGVGVGSGAQIALLCQNGANLLRQRRTKVEVTEEEGNIKKDKRITKDGDFLRGIIVIALFGLVVGLIFTALWKMFRYIRGKVTATEWWIATFPKKPEVEKKPEPEPKELVPAGERDWAQKIRDAFYYILSFVHH